MGLQAPLAYPEFRLHYVVHWTLENVVSDKRQLPRWSLNAPLGWVPELEEQQLLHGQGEPTLPTGRLGAIDHPRLLGLAGH
jgi:hypothetical protein